MEREYERLNNEENRENEEKRNVVVAVKKKKGKKHRERLLVLLLLLLFTGIMLGTSTYAWFTSNRTVSVQDITVDVEAKNGIQISANGSAWKSILQTADINGASSVYTTAVNQMPTSMEPVSTVGELDDDGFMKMFKGEILSSTVTSTLGEYILTATATDAEANTTTDGSFIAFDVFLKVDKDTDIWMTANSGVKSAIDDVDSGIKNAARIAFVKYGTVDSGSSLATIQGISRTATNDVYIWEPNYDVHTEAGVNNAHDVYGLTTTTTGAARLTYSGVKADIAESKNNLLGSASDTTLFSTVTPTYTTPAAGESYQLFSLDEGVTKIRVYMWIEGQDVDCENQASGSTIKYNLQITTIDPAGE